MTQNKSKGFQDPNKQDKAGRTKIFSFTSSGNFEKVKQLVENGANVNHRDHAGWSPLHVAALKGQYEIANYLIQNGAIINVFGFENDTPLHDACSFGQAECVKLLIDHGANVYALNSERKKPIDLCEDRECIDILKSKMTQLDQLALKDDQGRTCLHRACIQGASEDVLSHLKIGMNTNTLDIHQKSPLHYAVEQGQLSTTIALIDHGADINCLDSNNSTILHVACQCGHKDIVQYLIDAGVDVHAVDKNNQTPYQVAASVAIRQLITARIDQERKERVTTEAIDEITFVSNAKQKGSKLEPDATLSREERKIQAIMKSFENAEKKKKRAKRTSVDSIPEKKRQSRESSMDVDMGQSTNLQRRSTQGVTETSLRYGVEKHNTSYSPLHQATLNGQLKTVESLLLNNADVDCRCNKLNTPLHCAAQNGFADVIKLLLYYGADIHAKNAKGLTALDIASAENQKEIINILNNHQESKKRKIKHHARSESLPINQHAKVHARQLSGQHLPKKNLFKSIKTEEDILSPSPERWVIRKEEDKLYPSRYLPLYTIQLSDDFFVLDLQISLLLGISLHQFMKQYPLLHRKSVSIKEKERLWSPLSAMICTNDARKHHERQKFLDMDLHFVRLDHIVSIIKDDYNHLSESLITITLDIGYTKQNIKLPPKFAMKMKKCGLL